MRTRFMSGECSPKGRPILIHDGLGPTSHAFRRRGVARKGGGRSTFVGLRSDLAKTSGEVVGEDEPALALGVGRRHVVLLTGKSPRGRAVRAKSRSPGYVGW